MPRRADDRRKPTSYVPPRIIPHHLRNSLRRVTISWAFGSMWLYITTGAALTRYARLLGLPEYGFGILAALPFLAALAQLPSSYYMELYGHRKGLFLVSGLIHRLTWFAIAAIPWIAPEAWWWWSLVGLMAISSLGGHMATPGVLGWFADLVPSRVRGRYFSRRMQVGQAVGLVVTIAIGIVLDRAEAVDPIVLRRTISLALMVGGACGLTDFLILAFVPNPPTKKPDRHARFWGLLGEPLRDANFRRYLGFNATLTFSMAFVGQYIWLFVFDVVGLDNLQANVLLVAIPLVVSILCTPLWGRLVDKLGRRPVLLISGALIVPGAAAWVLVNRETWWLGYPIVLTSVFAWPGIELANFNILLGMTTSKEESHHGSAYVAVNSIAVAVAGAMSGLFGGLVAARMGDWQTVFLGQTITYHGFLFIVSAGLRLLALLWILRLEDPGAVTARAALRGFMGHIYSNVHQAFFMPGRRLGFLRRRTYSLRSRRARVHPDDD